MLLRFYLAARKNNLMFVEMRVSILLFMAALESLGMAVLQTLASVPEHTTNKILQI